MNFDKVLNYNDYFLNESKAEKVQIVMLVGGEKEGTPESFESSCKKRKIKFKVFNVNQINLEKTKDGHTILSSEGDLKISPNDTIILSRNGVLRNTHTQDIMNQLEDSRYFVVNRLKPMEICENKFTTGQYLEKADLSVPRYALIANVDDLDRGLKKIGGKFPVVMKLLKGSQGIGVSIVDSYNSLKSVYQTIKKVDDKNEVIIQEKIDSDFDLRVHVLIKRFSKKIDPENFEIIGVMKRKSGGKDFRTNYSLGGSVSKFSLSKELKEIAFKAANITGCNWCGVDIMIDKKTKVPYVLEVNSSPGTEGISKVIGSPIVDKVLDFLVDRNNWILPGLEIGYLEVVNVEGIGDVIAKFDTGNGTKSCCLHAEDVQEKGNYLHWKIGNKRFKKKIIDRTSVEYGSEGGTKEDRPMVEMDIEFNGKQLKGVHFSVVDRTEKSTPLLINRRTMKELDVIVNPEERFLVTDNFDEDYSPVKAKGSPHLGIKFLSKNKK
jgi:ribosomal protein S6--L-glutamate ligase